VCRLQGQGRIDSSILRQVKKPSISFLLIRLYGDFGSKEDAEWEEHNGIHQFAS